MKTAVRKWINRVGFDIARKHPLDLKRYAKYPQESLRSRRFYNVGAGSFRHPYWTNIDYSSDQYKCVQGEDFINYDLMELKPLPIENNSAELIYSTHTIEHVSDEAVFNLMKEAYRVLKPGGGIRLSTQDAALEYQAYLRNDRSYWYWAEWYSQPGTWEHQFVAPLTEASIHQLFLHHYATQLSTISADDTAPRKYSDEEVIEVFSKHSMEDGLNWFTRQCKFNPARPANHISWWSPDKVIAFLQKAGFSNCYRSGYGQSLFEPLREVSIFDTTHPTISLFVEAIK